jgi:hypothetical protein
MTAAWPARSAWSARPTERYYQESDHVLDDGIVLDGGAAQDAITDMACLLRDTRVRSLVSGVLLGAITIGIALETAFSGHALRHGMAGVFSAGLLCGLLACWARAAALLALSTRPVLDAVSELRWKTGAPLDPRARWLTLPPVGTDREEWSWIRAHLVLGAARLGLHRVQLAVTWTLITAACFGAWMVVLLVGL